MNYPLKLSFRILALTPQLSVTDVHGNLIFYVKQKLFKLKESVTVFADEQQVQPLYGIKADRVLDFSARYYFTDQKGTELGSVERQGMKSLWKARYDILDGNRTIMAIREENPWIKVLDGLFGEIPLIGMFSGYVFHPAFIVSRPQGMVVMRLKKQPSLFENRFTIKRMTELSQTEETQVLLSLLMMILLERRRG